MEEATKDNSQRIRLAAVGDILLTPPPDAANDRRCRELFADDVRDVFGRCDLVVGNLECTLPYGDEHVPTEPRVFTRPEWVRAVKEAGLDVVSLANNHMFDGLYDGFRQLQDLLAEVSLPCFGAGADIKQATAPAIVETNGLRVAFVGAADQRCGAYQFASKNNWGVASLDVDRIGAQILKLREEEEVDHVIVSIHWGEERFSIPSPVQIRQARQLVDCGATVILGHHPHVLQGVEIYRGAPIIYSLGNFIADDVYYSNGDAIRWNRIERTGCIVVIELTKDSAAVSRQWPTFDDGESVSIDDSGIGKERIAKTAQAISEGISSARYRREHLWVKTVIPTIDHLRPSRLKDLRFSHFQNALRMLLKSREDS